MSLQHQHRERTGKDFLCSSADGGGLQHQHRGQNSFTFLIRLRLCLLSNYVVIINNTAPKNRHRRLLSSLFIHLLTCLEIVDSDVEMKCPFSLGASSVTSIVTVTVESLLEVQLKVKVLRFSFSLSGPARLLLSCFYHCFCGTQGCLL